jgi:hypothetical protein
VSLQYPCRCYARLPLRTANYRKKCGHNNEEVIKPCFPLQSNPSVLYVGQHYYCSQLYSS